MKSRKQARCTRTGTTFIEAILSVILLSMLCAMLFPVIGRLMQVQTEVAQRQFALQELRNLAERELFLNQSPGEGPPELPTRVSDTLSNPELQSNESTQTDGSIRIDFTLSWEAAVGRPRSHVHLSCWRPGGKP